MDPSIVLGMIVKIVSFDFYGSIILTIFIVLEVNHPPLEPTHRRVVGIDTIINFDLFSWFPLRENPIGFDIDVLIISAGPSRVVHVCFVPLNIDNLSVDPFIFGVSDIDILTKVEVKFSLCLLHTSRIIYYNLNYRSHFNIRNDHLYIISSNIGLFIVSFKKSMVFLLIASYNS